MCDWPFHGNVLLCLSFVLWGQISETFEQQSCGMFLGEGAVGGTSVIPETQAERQEAKGGCGRAQTLRSNVSEA